MSVSVDGRTLTQGTDYSVTYRNNYSPGTATVYVYGTGNYTGQALSTFEIVKSGSNTGGSGNTGGNNGNTAGSGSQAGGTTKTQGDYLYSVSGGVATITKYIGSKNVTSLKIPAKLDGYSVVAIGKEAFESLQKLASVSIPEGVKSIGVSAFFGCTALKSVSLPSTLTRVDESGFYMAPIDNLVLPGSLKTIGLAAFGYTKCVTLPKEMNFFDWRCYVSYDGTCTLNSIKVAKGNKYFSYKSGVLYNKKKTALVYYLPSNKYRSFKVPNSVKTIKSTAFDYCSAKKITLGKKVQTLEAHAFLGVYGNGKTFTLPASVKKLGEGSLFFFGVKTLIVKTKKLTAKNVKGCLKYSNITKIRVKVGSAKANKKYAKKYRKIFSASNCGKRVSVVAG